MLQQAVHIVSYTYKWLQFAVADTAWAVLVVPIIATKFTCCAILDNLLYLSTYSYDTPSPQNATDLRVALIRFSNLSYSITGHSSSCPVSVCGVHCWVFLLCWTNWWPIPWCVSLLLGSGVDWTTCIVCTCLWVSYGIQIKHGCKDYHNQCHLSKGKLLLQLYVPL